MGSSNGNGCILKKKQITRGRKRDDLPPIGIVARRAISRYGISRQNKNASVNGRRTGINTLINKYASRRTSFFKSNRPQKATSQTAGLQCHDALWDKCERLFRTGDIISVTDKDNSLSYFAQIRTLLCNQLGQRFAALTWLVPTESADEAHQFDAEHFVHALSDSVMYPLEVCTFVQHAPLLPGYCHDWKPRSLVEKKLHEDLEKRVQIADSVLYEYELNNFVNPIIIITIEAIEVTELWKITKNVKSMYRLLKISIILFSIYQMFSFDEIDKFNESTKKMHYQSNEQNQNNICKYLWKFLIAKIKVIQYDIMKLANNEYIKAIAIVFLVIIFFFIVCLCSSLITYKLLEYFYSKKPLKST
ncbi:GATA zinc finger domain-containing protein [Dirofilaria immitis]